MYAMVFSKTTYQPDQELSLAGSQEFTGVDWTTRLPGYG